MFFKHHVLIAHAAVIAPPVSLAEDARREQRGEPSPMLAAILQQTALALALDHAETRCHRALDEALTFAVTDETADASAGHGSFCTPAYLEMQRGRCWAQLGKPGKAIPAFENALAALPAAYQRDRGVAYAGLAEALLADDQVERAAQAVGEALTIAQDSGSARIGGMVAAVADGLESHQRSEPVAELFAHLTGEA
ncbi:hypothetical protein [Actinomadura rubrisoli]|uniref:Uncharacterized protein n=1 Tax=Actinomadura rubrisoli TaxID=2530368 RepID=A0A4R5AVS1_9ACTN|nr:hypothetical protein [Actinomadura rubrisoli]TDD76210.1 hypothetical protein E1298_30905 [Actinomadura rubrisoli]